MQRSRPRARRVPLPNPHARQEIRASGTARPPGPIPQGVKAGGFVFLSGMRGVDPATQRIETTDPEGQARQAFENLKVTLAAAGATLGDVVKVGVYLRDLHGHRPILNVVWAEYFGASGGPARHVVQVSDLGDADGKTLFLLDVTALAHGA